MQKEVTAIFLFLITILILTSCAPDLSPPERQGSIGFIGCSNTRQTVQGYQWAGGQQLWMVDEDAVHEYDGGAVLNWANSDEKGYDEFWEIFDAYIAHNPATGKVWWQLCMRREEAAMTYEQVVPVLERIREKIPGVTVYVSALPDFPEHECGITGVEGIERAKALVQELDLKNEDVVAGPIIGPLFLADIDDDDESKCHPHVEGAIQTGRQLQAFFDNPELGIENSMEDSLPAENQTSLEEAESAEAHEQPDEPQEELSPEEQVWRGRIEKALAPTPCSDIPLIEFPATYYQGPLLDTHLHIPAIPDWSPEEDGAMENEEPEGRFGGPQALLGWNVKMSEIACTLKQEGTHKNFAFFPVYEGEISLRLLEIWNRTMHEYPTQFTPFIMSSGNDDEPNGFPTVDARTLREMLAVYPGLFQGYGEIGLYERENGGSPELPPDAPRLQEIYPLLRQHNLVVYFHLGDGHKDNFERVLKQNPDLTFIWHGDQLSVDEVKDILRKYPNVYYGIDEFFGGEREIFELYVGESKEEYLEMANQKFDQIVQQGVRDWKSLIEQYPDRVLWGTDRGDAVWNYDLDVGQMQVKIARAFIGKLDPAVQEKFAYKNAERLIAAR